MSKFGCLTSRFVLICWVIASIIYNFYFLKKIKFSDEINAHDGFVVISAFLNIILDIYVVIFTTIDNRKWLKISLYIIIANIVLLVGCFILTILRFFGVFGDEEVKTKFASVVSLLKTAMIDILLQALEFVWIRRIVKKYRDSEEIS